MSSLSAQVQRPPPFGPLGPKRVVPLAAGDIQPVVRIAHRVLHPINIPERILFDHELVLILAGAGELRLGGERCLYRPHDLMFIPPFLPHSFTAEVGCLDGDHVAVHFDFCAYSTGPDAPDARVPYEVRIAPGLSIPRCRFVLPGGPLETALLALVSEQAASDPLACLRVSREMLTVLAAVLRAPSGSEPSGPGMALDAKNRARTQRVIAFIHSHLHAPLDAGHLASVADMSVSRMNTVFRQATGYSPLEYVRQVRVAEARRLLADPELAVKEIAARIGFEDGFHFSRVFRRTDGLSPTEYRAALLASQPLQQAVGETDRE